jgi:hypothetical protein
MIMHHETSGSTRNYERHLDKAFQFMNDNGYEAVKVGYVGYLLANTITANRSSIITNMLSKSSRLKIMINAHEAVRPTNL